MNIEKIISMLTKKEMFNKLKNYAADCCAVP